LAESLRQKPPAGIPPVSAPEAHVVRPDWSIGTVQVRFLAGARCAEWFELFGAETKERGREQIR